MYIDLLRTAQRIKILVTPWTNCDEKGSYVSSGIQKQFYDKTAKNKTFEVNSEYDF